MTGAETADRLERAAGLNALLTPIAEVRRALAAQAATAPADGAVAGMPVVVKDNICTLEFTTSCGSRILEGYRSPYEATAITRLKAAGALIAGKTNCDEFAMGSSTEHSAFGRTHHPLDPTRVPGGSSGGSAALVGAGAVPAALGSETGGSVRQPAAFCGVVGIKPTYGRVSRYGLVAFGSSLDQIGVCGRTVSDAGRVLAAISGRDPLDSTCEDRDPLRLPAVPENLQGFVIGIPKEYFPPDLDPGVRRACDRLIRLLKDLGAAVRDVDLWSDPADCLPTYTGGWYDGEAYHKVGVTGYVLATSWFRTEETRQIWRSYVDDPGYVFQPSICHRACEGSAMGSSNPRGRMFVVDGPMLVSG